MTDAELRAIERRAAQGDPDALDTLGRARVQFGRGPLTHPIPGDVVEVRTPCYWTRRVVLHPPSEKHADLMGPGWVWWAWMLWSSRNGDDTHLIPDRRDVAGLRVADRDTPAPASTWRGIGSHYWSGRRANERGGQEALILRENRAGCVSLDAWRRWARKGVALRAAPPGDPRRYFHGRVLRLYPRGANEPEIILPPEAESA